MLKLGIVGTGWISRDFVKAAQESQQYEFHGLYSRSSERADQFLAELDPEYTAATLVFDNYQDLLDQVEVVYIASPNSVHFEQVQAAIAADVNVIVEKTALANPAEFSQVKELLAQHPGVRFFEAARHIYQDNFHIVSQALKNLPVIQGATLVMAQYSSRYDAYLAGENPNVFNLDFAAGALYDLGVYPLYAALAWFGQPLAVQYLPVLLDNGADGGGTATLFYGDYNVTLLFSKTHNTTLPSEIYGRRDLIQISHIADWDHVKYFDGRGHSDHLGEDDPERNPMLAEAKAFANMINQPDETQAEYQKLFDLAELVNHTLYQLRQSANLVFPADEGYDDQH
ncbi:Gfo/Idh/MocA family oxidoreductase [Lactobacillaceae bacterium L1_55_11]|nr:Gfo/Idh/MocA family oxidoreductase [Lactobacillaceae bacterium L1_55_11]